MTEQTMIRKMRSRDPAGLEALMDRYIPYVSAVVWNLLRFSMQPEDAEEVVSDVFLAAWNQAKDLQSGKVKAWLAAVARNKAKSKLRSMAKDLPLEEDLLELPGRDSPETELTQTEERFLVNWAVNDLPEPDKEIFLRHYYHAQTVREISEEMALKESTIKTKLRRGRAKLKETLTRWGAI
ncbi:MAG: sigma-70 family RNA polymerase sigma factor [Oscillospiraceae bacterium]|nr:sigma-70 family RNA polymerase sigma factor [Oscillospiraceae bacterium]